VDPKLIGATNVRLIANKIAGEATPATYDFKAAAIPQALLTAQPGAVNVASLGKIIPGWGQTEDFIAPWFATLEAKKKMPVALRLPGLRFVGRVRRSRHPAKGAQGDSLPLRIQPQYAADWP
jgi:hypothetical protein